MRRHRRRRLRITIAATGDLTFGREGAFPPGGAAEVLNAVGPALRSDLTLGNLETTLGSVAGSKCAPGSSNCFAFEAPASDARALEWTGFDLLNLANNHANDYGAAGQASTTSALTVAGLRYTGKPGQVALLRRHGLRVAVVGFAPYPWAASLLDIPRATRLIRAAARRADLVLATMHAGAEGTGYEHVRPGAEAYLGEQRGDVMKFAHAAVDAGADLVVGHGPHVLRGLEWYHGRLIAYSLGNFAGYHTLSTEGDLGVSAVLRVTLRKDGGLVRGSLTSIRLDATGSPSLDPSHAAWTLTRRLSADDFGARAAGPDTRGRIRPELAPSRVPPNGSLRNGRGPVDRYRPQTRDRRPSR